MAEINRICTCLVGESGLAHGHVIDFMTDDARHYELIFSRFSMRNGFFFPRTNWFNIELNFYPGAQADLQKILHGKYRKPT